MNPRRICFFTELSGIWYDAKRTAMRPSFAGPARAPHSPWYDSILVRPGAQCKFIFFRGVTKREFQSKKELPFPNARISWSFFTNGKSDEERSLALHTMHKRGAKNLYVCNNDIAHILGRIRFCLSISENESDNNLQTIVQNAII